MPNETIISCDACKKTFRLTVQQIRNRQSGELIFRYIECPECGTAFLSSVTDETFRKLLRKGGVSRKDQRAISDILKAKHFNRFRELVPAAYEGGE